MSIMRSDWILDVLADLKAFAQSNGLPKLAEHLDDASLCALAEIANQSDMIGGQTNGKTDHSRTDLGRAGNSSHS
jgi:hypothetical protein